MRQSKLKLYHIHNDPKFISSTRRFECDYFDNYIIILSSGAKYDIYNNNIVTYFKPQKKNIKAILQLCRGADLVVLYGLCHIKSRIANRLPIGVKIAWRFFGYELYNERKTLFLSPVTLEILKTKGLNRHIDHLKTSLRPVRQYVFWGSTNSSEFYNAINRVDFFLGLCVDEYNTLIKLFTILPKFVQLPFGPRAEKDIKLEDKEKAIVIGNSRNPFNNHLDIINEIRDLNNYTSFTIIIPFSYPEERRYFQQIMLRVKGCGNIKFIEEFTPIAEYEYIFEKASAFIMNSIRQLGVGNIFLAIKNKAKVYLNPQNVLFNWFLREGFKIYSVTELKEDIEKNNLRLDNIVADNNIEMLTALCNRYNLGEFQKYILAELCGSSTKRV